VYLMEYTLSILFFSVPEGAPYLTNVTGLTSQSIYIEWQVT